MQRFFFLQKMKKCVCGQLWLMDHLFVTLMDHLDLLNKIQNVMSSGLLGTQ